MTDLESALAGVREEFVCNFTDRGELGASLSIWLGENEICSLHQGFRDRGKSVSWSERTLVPVWSATKGPAAACVLLALHDRGFAPETPAGEIWPELGSGKLAWLPVGDLLAHRGGLSALDAPARVEDYPAVIRALESQPPQWDPRASHGYHPRTFGFLADELVRRLSGEPLGVFWRRRVAGPLGLDLWIGLPAGEDHRVAEMLPPHQGQAEPDSAPFYHALADARSLTHRSFRSPAGLEAVRDMNRPEIWRLSLPAFGGIGSASALAKFYAALANGGRWGGSQVFPSAVCAWAEPVRASGADLVLLHPTAFSAGFMKNSPQSPNPERRRKFGPSPRAFGHPGAGGSHAFADPERGLGFAYVMNQMERSVFPTRKALSLVERCYGMQAGAAT